MSQASAWTGRVATVVGFVLLAPVGFLYVVSGLVVPQPWLYGLWAAWLGLAAYAFQHRAEPWRVLATPVVAVLLWVGVVMVGGALLGWTA
jgi:hypothetical protein